MALQGLDTRRIVRPLGAIEAPVDEGFRDLQRILLLDGA